MLASKMVQALASHKVLTYMYLNNNWIGDVEVSKIIQILASHKVLTRLDFSSNLSQIDDVEASALKKLGSWLVNNCSFYDEEQASATQSSGDVTADLHPSEIMGDLLPLAQEI